MSQSPAVARRPSPLLSWSRRLAIFAAVGLAATAVHGAVAWLLLGSVHGLVANAAGFAVALGVSYVGNYFLTFRSQAAHGETLLRFLVVSALTLAISEWILVLLYSMGAEPTASLVVAVAAVPLLRFGMLARNVFDHSRQQAVPFTPWLTGIGVWIGAAGAGIVALAAMAPDGLLDPTSELWRLPGGDRGIAVAGMRYYLADDWHWPLLHTDDLNTPDGANIALTDSLPLLAVVAKLGRPLLGREVNYFGSWFLLAYTLQGVAAVALLRSLKVRRPELLLGGAVLAVTFPAFVFRAFHPALSGQFIILLTLAAAFASARPGPSDDEHRRARAPLINRYQLLTVAGLVVALLLHPYLLLMTAPLVAGIYLDHWLRRRLDAGQVAAAAGVALVAGMAVLVAGGYLGRYEPTLDYGSYGLNVVGPVYPQLSGVIPGDQPPLAVGQTLEGFNWLGSGVLVLAAGAVALTGHRQLWALARRWPGVITACLGLTVVAVSHRIAYGRSGLLDLGPSLAALHGRPVSVAVVALAALAAAAVAWRQWPAARIAVAAGTVAILGAAGVVMAGGRALSLLSVVRASGRLWWSVGLLVTLVTIALLGRANRARVGVAVLTVAAVLQVVDTGPIRDMATQGLTVSIPMPGAEQLVAAAEHADQVRVSPSFFCAPYPEGAFAALDAIVVASAADATPVDTVYTARRPADLECPGPVRSFGDDELLVLVTPDRREPGALLTADHQCRDDGRVLACTRAWAGLPVADTAPFRPVVAEPVTFGQGGDAALVMDGGWGEAEPWGRVIPADGASLSIPLVGEVTGPLAVRLRLRSTTAEPARVIVVAGDDRAEPGGGGNEHRLEVSGAVPGDHQVAVDSAAAGSLQLRLRSAPAGPPAGIDELTVLLAG